MIENSKKFLRLVKDAIKGDENSLKILLQMRSKNILYIAMHLMRDKQAAEDVAQEVAAMIQRDIKTLKNPQSFDAWMYRVVYNACLDEKKKMSRAKNLIAIDSQIEEMVLEQRDELLPEEFVSRDEKRRELITAINELPDMYRDAILLFYYEGMSYQEISEIMGVSLSDVSNYLWRARKKLRARLVVPNGTADSDDDSSGGHKDANAAAMIPHITRSLHQEEERPVSHSPVSHFTSAIEHNASQMVSRTEATTSLRAEDSVGKPFNEQGWGRVEVLKAWLTYCALMAADSTPDVPFGTDTITSFNAWRVKRE